MSEEQLCKIFGKNLSKLLSEKNISKYKFSKDLGISRVSIYGWIKGDFLPRTEVLLKMSDYLGVNIDSLLREN